MPTILLTFLTTILLCVAAAITLGWFILNRNPAVRQALYRYILPHFFLEKPMEPKATSDSMQESQCPNCQKRLRGPEHLVQARVRCPKCGVVFRFEGQTGSEKNRGNWMDRFGLGNN